ncbi:hypothetical protein G9464_14895 [Halostella sp. JP-L12]|uniref:DUF7523 family protein n=1 Tax=Halostella TaxID=1843185 RepID=UPI000EF83A5B|nr:MULTISPECIES: hypothetical protein [Halostella]NHN48874.1 hypothetical protein [Halostella sp. JP-L12]
MSLAERTREAVRARPFLLDGLRAGVINYTAAARHLDVDGDADAIATALRRFAEELPTYETDARTARVTMESGLGRTDDAASALLVVGDAAMAPTGGSLTGVLATGDVDPPALATVLRRLAATGVTVEAAATADDALLVVVERRASADAVRTVEDALGEVPDRDY